MLKSLAAFMLAILTVILFNMGLDWIEIGKGLHPIVAFPLSTISFLTVLFLHKL